MNKEKRIVLACFIIALFCFLGKKSHRLEKARFLSYTLYKPFLNSIYYIKELNKTLAKNKKLLRQVSEQEAELINLRNRLNDIENVNQILDLQKFVIPDFIVANTVGLVQNYISRRMLIDKGFIDGIKKDLPVISTKGVIGKIVSVEMNHSTVLPIQDPLFKLSLMTKNNRAHGILNISRNGTAYMKMIPLKSKLSIGDTLITSNLSPIFPKGILVGEVVKVMSSQSNLYLEAEIDLFANSYNTENVMVLKETKFRK